MFIRKVKAAAYTSIFALVFSFIIFPIPMVDGGLLIALLVYPVYVLPVVFIWGVGFSILADKLAKKPALSFFLHLFFGALFPPIFGLVFESLSIKDLGPDLFILFTTILGGIFYGIDYFLKRRVTLHEPA